MAILPGFPGFEVTIRVNGVALQEYQDAYEAEPDTPDRITRYVQATSGAKFDIFFKRQQGFQLPNHEISVDIILDGHCVEKQLILKTQLDSPHFTRRVYGALRGSNGNYRLHPFMFSELDIVDSALVEERFSAREMVNLGEIDVLFHYKRIGQLQENPSFNFGTHEIDKISEKTLKGKAISHSARLGEGEVAQKPQAYLGEFVYDRNKPFAAFKFKYRSLEALQAACIIPRSPSSESELKADELREFHGRERRSNAALKRERNIKHERSENTGLDGADNDIELLHERPAKFRKLVETIDLTGDGDDE